MVPSLVTATAPAALPNLAASTIPAPPAIAKAIPALTASPAPVGSTAMTG